MRCGSPTKRFSGPMRSAGSVTQRSNSPISCGLRTTGRSCSRSRAGSRPFSQPAYSGEWAAAWASSAARRSACSAASAGADTCAAACTCAAASALRQGSKGGQDMERSLVDAASCRRRLGTRHRAGIFKGWFGHATVSPAACEARLTVRKRGRDPLPRLVWPAWSGHTAREPWQLQARRLEGRAAARRLRAKAWRSAVVLSSWRAMLPHTRSHSAYTDSSAMR